MAFADTLPPELAAQVDQEHRVLAAVQPADEISRARVMDAAQTAAFVGLSLVHFRRLYRSGLFPPPLKLSARKLGWRTGDVLDHLDRKAKEAA